MQRQEQSHWIPAFAGMTSNGNGNSNAATARHSANKQTSKQANKQTSKQANKQTKTPAETGAFASTMSRHCRNQNVTLQLSILPTSPPALSFTRSFHVPFSASVERFSVTVLLMLSVLEPVQL